VLDGDVHKIVSAAVQGRIGKMHTELQGRSERGLMRSAFPSQLYDAGRSPKAIDICRGSRREDTALPLASGRRGMKDTYTAWRAGQDTRLSVIVSMHPASRSLGDTSLCSQREDWEDAQAM